MLQLAHLLLNRRVDSRIGVAKEIDPPGADGIDKSIAFKVLKPDTLATLDGHQRHGAFVVFHLGAGVPHGLEATGDEVSIAHDNSPSDGLILGCRC